MLGDNFQIRPEYYTTADAIVEHVLAKANLAEQKICITVGGESGSGKSVTAICVGEVLAKKGYKNVILHQDDYFHLPPETNRLKRAESLDWVGIGEVNMQLMEEHIDAFRHNASSIVKPLVIFKENRAITETISLDGVQVILVEGTYTSTIKSADCRVFMLRNYIDTHAQRVARGRDVFDENLNTILDIEHKIIAPHHALADILVHKDYSVEIVQHAAL